MQGTLWKKLYTPVAWAGVLALAVPWAAFASAADTSIVDTDGAVSSVTLAPGASGTITINLMITGKQDGTATFQVNREYTLSGGTFTGSNPSVVFSLGPRAATAPPAQFSATGSVSVAPGQADGNFTLKPDDLGYGGRHRG